MFPTDKHIRKTGDRNLISLKPENTKSGKQLTEAIYKDEAFHHCSSACI
jgi:hypothetical protein